MIAIPQLITQLSDKGKIKAKRINKGKSETKRKIPHFDSNCENSSKKIAFETVAMLKTAVCSRIRNKSFCFKGNF